MNNNFTNKNKIYPIKLSKDVRTMGNFKDLKENISTKFSINKTLKNFQNKNENLNNYKESPLLKNKISIKEGNSPDKNFKKTFSSFNIIKVSSNLVQTQSLESNSTNNINKENNNFEKLLNDNTQTLCSLIKVFNNKINEILQWLITKSSSIKQKRDNLFYYQLSLFQRKVGDFQNKLLTYFKILIEDLNYGQKDENLDVLGPNLDNFYHNIMIVNDFLLKKIKKINYNNNNNKNFYEKSSLTTKNISYDIKLNNKLPLLKDKNIGYNLSRNNFNAHNNNTIIDEIEEINNNDKNKIKVKKLFFLKEKENLLIDKFKNNNKTMDNKTNEEKENLSEKKENNNINDIINDKNNNNKNYININKRNQKLTFADFFKNVNRKKKIKHLEI